MLTLREFTYLVSYVNFNIQATCTGITSSEGLSGPADRFRIVTMFSSSKIICVFCILENNQKVAITSSELYLPLKKSPGKSGGGETIGESRFTMDFITISKAFLPYCIRKRKLL